MSGLCKRGEIQEQGRIEVRYALPMLDLVSPTFAMNTTTVLGTNRAPAVELQLTRFNTGNRGLRCRTLRCDRT